MDAATLKTLTDYVSELVREGEAVEATKWTVKYQFSEEHWVEPVVFSKWHSRLSHLAHLLGDHAAPWRERLTGNPLNAYGNCLQLLGTVKAIQQTLASGLLIRVQDLVLAEAFDSLLEQAEYLFGEGYTLAAGVVGRAVLEEHLRTLCANAKVALTAARPTLGDLYQALYRGNHLTKIELKHVESMAAVGNDAAHNNPLNRADVERLLRDVREFLLRHPT